MTLGQLIAQARILLDDRKAPFLWDDDSLTLWLNEAQREAVERGRLLYDKVTTALCQINLVEGQYEYPLDPLVIDVDVARLRSGRRPLERSTDERFQCYSKTRVGPAQEFLVYETGGQLMLRLDRQPPDPTDLPAESYTPILDLQVYRFPLADMVDMSDAPEILSALQLNLIHWAAYRAFSTRDSDAGDSDRADRADATFTRAFGQKIDANVRRKQLRHRATICRPQRC